MGLMSFPTYGSSVTESPLSLRSRTLFHFRGSMRSLDALSGQVGTLTRGATGTAIDSFGNSYTAVGVQPRWESRDTNADTVRDALGLFMDTADRLAWPVLFLPSAMGGIMEFVQVATMALTGTVFYLGNDAGTGARLSVFSTGSNYAIAHVSGVTVSSTMGAPAPTAGDRVRLRFQLSGTGTVQLWQSLNGGAEVASALSGANALAAAWAATAKVRLNSVGSGTATTAWYRLAKLVYGTPSASLLSSIL